MKRVLLLLAAVAIGFTAMAQTQRYLNFERIDGKPESVAIAYGMTVQFYKTSLRVMLNDAQFYTVPYEQINSFHISATGTSIQNTTTDGPFRVGALVEVFSIDGRKAATYRHGQGGEPQLSTGLYIFRSEGKSFKQWLP